VEVVVVEDEPETVEPLDDDGQVVRPNELQEGTIPTNQTEEELEEEIRVIEQKR
jgi:hypothetical protein